MSMRSGVGVVRLGNGPIEWQFAYVVLVCFAEERPDLLETILKPAEISTAQAFSQSHSSGYAEAADYVHVVKQCAPAESATNP